jgi:hypothetical protein
VVEEGSDWLIPSLAHFLLARYSFCKWIVLHNRAFKMS